jgi:hypothetical protein
MKLKFLPRRSENWEGLSVLVAAARGGDASTDRRGREETQSFLGVPVWARRWRAPPSLQRPHARNNGFAVGNAWSWASEHSGLSQSADHATPSKRRADCNTFLRMAQRGLLHELVRLLELLLCPLSLVLDRLRPFGQEVLPQDLLLGQNAPADLDHLALEALRVRHAHGAVFETLVQPSIQQVPANAGPWTRDEIRRYVRTDEHEAGRARRGGVQRAGTGCGAGTRRMAEGIARCMDRRRTESGSRS